MNERMNGYQIYNFLRRQQNQTTFFDVILYTYLKVHIIKCVYVYKKKKYLIYNFRSGY